MASPAPSRRESVMQGSQNPSPSASLQKPVTQLENLVNHLLASKRSLSSIHQVHRATTILFKVKSVIESTTGLGARTAFLQRSLATQLKILRGVQYEVEEVVRTGHAEFNSYLKELDEVGKRLQQTVNALRNTRVEPGFRGKNLRTSSTSDGASDIEAKETLYDFVDDGPVEELKDALKASIDEAQKAKKQMDQSLQDFEEELQAMNATLVARTTTSSSSSSTFQPPNIPTILAAMENHAREVALSLESLVKHFDLCVTAIHHTEGGGAAFAKNVDATELPEGVGVEGFEAPTRSITEEEKKEMMEVIENDASEVEEVVIEIQNRINEMEGQLDQVSLWSEKKEGEYDDVMAVLKMLEKTAQNLPVFINQSQRFLTRWGDEKIKIEEGMAGLEDLRDVYRNFLGAYDGLIVEVARRKAVRNHMEKILKEAHARLQQLYDDDVEERESFRVEQGEFLPMDIWPGLSDPPPKYAISRLGDDPESVPDLPRRTVEDALKRLKAARTRS